MRLLPVVSLLEGRPVKLIGTGLFACHRIRRGGSPAGVSHLLVADDALHPGYAGGSQIAVCGVQVHPDSPTAVEPAEDPGYCPVCVRAAVRWNTRRAAR